MVGLNAYKLKLPHSQISYRKSESVEVTNAELVPLDMKNVTVKEDISKTKIKEYLETQPNRECEYAKIATKVNINIK